MKKNFLTVTKSVACLTALAVYPLAMADAGGGAHSHGPEGPLLIKILGGLLIVGVSVIVYFGFLKKKKK